MGVFLFVFFSEKILDCVFYVLYSNNRHTNNTQKEVKRLSKKRINIYLSQKTIDKADELARELSYKLGTDLNRSNIFEIAVWWLSKQDLEQVEQIKSIFKDQ